MRPRLAHALLGLAVAALLAVGLYVRAVPATDRVFGGDEPRLLGNDAYYHLRHARFAAQHFPDLLRWDTATHYPTGQRAYTAGLYDLGMAAAAWVYAGGEPDEAALRTVVAWTPCVLGILALLLVVLLERRLLDLAAGVMALAVVTLYPGGFLTRTLVGFADHHAAEVVLLLWMLWGFVGVLADPGEASRRRLWLRAALQALPVALVTYTWRGAPLYVAMFGLAAVVTLLLEVGHGRADLDLARRLARYAVAALVLVGLPAVLAPVLVMDTYLFPMVLVGIALLGLFCAAYLWVARRLLARGWSGLRIVGLTVLVLGVAAVLAVISLEAARRALRFLTQPKVIWVREHIPVTPERIWSLLGLPGFVALLSPALCLWLTRRDPRRLAQRFATVFVALMLTLWWLSHDYEYVMAPLSALASVLVLRLALERVPAVAAGWRRTAAAGGFVVLVAVPVWPLGWHRDPWCTDESVRELVVVTDGWRDALRWMSDHTPEPTLPADAVVEPFGDDFHYPSGTYGVLNAWDYGNFVSALAHRDTVISQEVSAVTAEWLLIPDEDESLAFWAERMDPGEAIRYVVIDAKTLSDHFGSLVGQAGRDATQFVEMRGDPPLPVYDERFFQTIGARLYFGGGTDLSHYRLVYESPERALIFHRAQQVGQAPNGSPRYRVRLRSESFETPRVPALYEALQEDGLLRTGAGLAYQATVRPMVRVFEVVSGASLLGRAAPGAHVEAQLALRSRSTGVSWVYRRSVEVGRDGRFRLTLPYATEESDLSDIVATDLYQVYLVGDAGEEPTFVARIGVPEAYVLSGEALDLGDLERRRTPP